MPSMKEILDTIKEIHPDASPTILVPRARFIYHLIVTLKTYSVPVDCIKRIDPFNAKPACDIDSIELHPDVNRKIRNIVLYGVKCYLCKHLPYTPVCCDSCGLIYCDICVTFLARLLSTFKGKPLPVKFSMNLKMACIVTKCSNGKIVERGVISPEHDIVKTFSKFIRFGCNRVNCDFKAIREPINLHRATCKAGGIKVNGSVLPDYTVLEIEPDCGDIWDLIYEQAERSLNVISRTSLYANIVTAEVEKIGDLGELEKLPLGIIVDQSIDWTESAAPSPLRLYLPVAFLTASKGRFSTFGPSPEGETENEGIEFSKVTADQLIGRGRASKPIDRDTWRKRWLEANETIKDPVKLQRKIQSIARRTYPDLKKKTNKANRVRQDKRYAEALQKITPSLHLPNKETPAAKMVTKNIAWCRDNQKTVVALDIEGQLLMINGSRYSVPGSVAIVGYDGKPVVHEIVRWSRESLEKPDSPNPMTGLNHDLSKYGSTLTYVRYKLAKILFKADIIIMHGQAGDLKAFFFQLDDYEKIEYKIRDIGQYYKVKSSNTMALQLSTFLLFQKVIQNGLHFALEDAYWTLMLYYADMQAIEDTYNRCKFNRTYDADSFPETIYPPNAFMARLWIDYADRFSNWPTIIRKRHYGKWRKPLDTDECTEPAETARPPYDIDIASFECFYQ